MNDRLILAYDHNPPDIPTLIVSRIELVLEEPHTIPVPKSTIVNTFHGREAEKIYALLTQSCGAIFDMDDWLREGR